MSFCTKWLPATYFFGFNVVHTAVSALLTGLSIYLMVGENTQLNRALLACSILYLVISMWGLGYRRGFSGLKPGNFYLVLLAMMTIFQVCMFLAFTLFEGQSMKQLGMLDSGVLMRAYNFISSNIKNFQTLLGVGAVSQVLALISAIMISRPTAVVSRDYNSEYDVHRAYAVEYV